MGQPIDRNNKEDLLKQIGRTEEKIANQNRLITKIDNEIKNWGRRRLHLERMKKGHSYSISRHQAYIKELENDLEQ